ncbi:MAG: VCBS repeat-containing protein, partial [Pyrinomonadaceae bacterium]
MLRRRTLIHLSITFALLVIACAVFYWKFVRPFFEMTGGGEIPQELRDPGVRVGEGLLSRGEFVKLRPPGFLGDYAPGIGGAHDVAVGELDGQPGPDVVVAGTYGARVFDLAGAERSEITYGFETKEVKLGPFSSSSPKMMLGDFQIIDIDGDGTCEYLGRGSLDGAAVFDHGGRVLWSYGAYEEGKTSIDDMAAGDLNGDGTVEFVTAWDIIRLHDRHGGKIWERPGDGSSHHIEVADADGDGKPEILASGGRHLIVTDIKGKPVRMVELPFYFWRFSVCARPDGRKQLLAVEDGHVWTFDSKAESVGRLPAPLAELKVEPRQTLIGDISEVSVYQSEGAWVKLDAARPEALAVITQYVVMDRSVLYVYDSSGALVYMEVLPEECYSVAALPAEEGRPQEFLVGCENTV